MNKQAKKSKINKKGKIGISVILAVIIFLLAGLFVVDSFAPASPKPFHKWVLSTFSGSFDGEDAPNTFYQVQIQKNVETGERQYSCINTKISTTNSENVKEIWVCFSDLYEDNIEIFLSTGWEGRSKFLSQRNYSKADVKRNKDGWFRIYNTGKEDGLVINSSGFYGQLRIGFSSNVKVREIVVVDMKGNLGSISVDHCSNGDKPSGEGEYSNEHGNKFSRKDANNVCDEKETFKAN